jgi:POT family proton-dependent oligopeptide transporter
MDFSIPVKFAFGMSLCACSFLLLKFVAMFFADNKRIISGNWLLLSYGLQSIGDLLIGGLGLAMVCRLISQRMMGFMMGIWYISMAVAILLGGYVASLAAIPQDITNPVLTLPIYSNLFLKIGVASFVISIIMFLFVPTLKRHFVKES